MIDISGTMKITETQFQELSNNDAIKLVEGKIKNSVVHECLISCLTNNYGTILDTTSIRKHDFKIEFSAIIGE